MENWMIVATALGVLGCGIVSAIFMVFSDFLMRSFALAQPEGGIEVMQILNREINRSVTILMLWGMWPVSAALAGYAYMYVEQGMANLFIAAAVLYFASVIGLTFTFNVPMNLRLDKMDGNGAHAQEYWPEYVRRWVFWNWLRALGALAAGLCYVVVLGKLL